MIMKVITFNEMTVHSTSIFDSLQILKINDAFQVQLASFQVIHECVNDIPFLSFRNYFTSVSLMYQSIPSLTILSPGKRPWNFFERVNSPPPGHKERAKPRPQKNCATTSPPGQLFSKIQQKSTQNMRQKL